MKKIIVFFVCVLLSACSYTTNIKSSIDEVFSIDSESIRYRRNNYTDYVDFYLPSDIQEYSSDKLSNIFTYNDSKIIMDINIPAILNTEYYPYRNISDEGFFDNNKLVYHKEGSYLDIEENAHNYFFNIYEYHKQYLLYFVSGELVFYGYCDENDLLQTCSKILLIAKSSQVKDSDIIANYSTKDVIDYEKKHINPFEKIMPVNGVINDFLVDDYKYETNE